jgi:glycosyltransferase involved in cell wall biosynthesis
MHLTFCNLSVNEHTQKYCAYSLVKVTHIITDLDRGGCEGVLARLVTYDNSNTHEIIVLKDKGVYGDKLVASGVNVVALGMTNRTISLKAFVILYRYLLITKPDVVQTWMFHADLVGGVVAKIVGIKKIFWGIRAASIKLQPINTRLVIRLCSLFSYFIPTKIVCCGVMAKQVMSNNFYSKRKLSIIHNGCDVNKFDKDGAIISRNILNPALKQNDYLIGFVARWDSHKDIPNLLAALNIVIKNRANIKFLFVGEGLNENNNELCEIIGSAGLTNNIILLGTRNDIPDFMRTIDVCVLSSVSEAFPNVLLESMACCSPCVTTDVGDTRLIVDETGWIVPHSNHKALAKAIIEAVSEIQDEQQWGQRGKKCRDRIVNKFSLDYMVKSYLDLWNS